MSGLVKQKEYKIADSNLALFVSCTNSRACPH